MTELEKLRMQIDAIDQQIVRLLEERMDLSRSVGKIKTEKGLPVLDANREKEVLQSRAEMLQHVKNAEMVRDIYHVIMRYSRAAQRKTI